MNNEDIFYVGADRDINQAVEELFTYWRLKGYPDYNLNNYDKIKEINKLINFNENSIINGKNYNQTMLNCGFLWTYFPHWKDVKCGKDKYSLMENWNDDKKLRSLILKTYKWELKHGNGKFTINRLRQNAKVYCSKQSVSNFRPTVAKSIYNEFGNKGTVWDMCAGWGGRLFGFLASDCKTYIGTEPSSLTYDGLTKIKEDFTYLNKNVELYKIGSEDYIPKSESLDLCFTSPPYFDTEKYSDEESQSYIKYPTKEDWLSGYLSKTIENCWMGLKHRGNMIINISNTSEHDFLEESTLDIAEKIGFKLIDTRYLVLSSIAGKGIKTEPIFIFKKDK